MQLYMKNKDYYSSLIFKNYQEDTAVAVRIPAVIYIPNRILLGIVVADDANIDNKFPHVVFLTGR